MLVLYHNDMSVCAQKVRIALAEKGLEWEGRHLNLRRDEQFDPEYVKLNPKAVVPTLVDDGFVIIDSNFINEYLDDAYPDPPLHPADAQGRSRMRAWTKQLDDSIHDATSVMTMSIAFRYQFFEANTEDELQESIAKVPDPIRRESKRAMIYEGVEAQQFAGAIKRMDKLLTDMETALEAGLWLVGESYSLADIAFISYITRLEHLRLTEMIEKRPRVADWHARIKARPSYEIGLGKWVSQDYLALMAEKSEQEKDKVYAALAAA